MANVNLPLGAGNTGTNDWADVYNNDAAIVAQVNGNLDQTNLANGAATSDKISISYYTDTQSANITASGVLTGISVTPAAGTYFCMATAELKSQSLDWGQISLRRAGSNVTSGPAAGPIDNANDYYFPLVVHDILTFNGSQTLEVYYSGGAVAVTTVASGRLTAIRLV